MALRVSAALELGGHRHLCRSLLPPHVLQNLLGVEVLPHLGLGAQEQEHEHVLILALAGLVGCERHLQVGVW